MLEANRLDGEAQIVAVYVGDIHELDCRFGGSGFIGDLLPRFSLTVSSASGFNPLPTLIEPALNAHYGRENDVHHRWSKGR